jgi:hypothetical protein
MCAHKSTLDPLDFSIVVGELLRLHARDDNCFNITVNCPWLRNCAGTGSGAAGRGCTQQRRHPWPAATRSGPGRREGEGAGEGEGEGEKGVGDRGGGRGIEGRDRGEGEGCMYTYIYNTCLSIYLRTMQLSTYLLCVYSRYIYRCICCMSLSPYINLLYVSISTVSLYLYLCMSLSLYLPPACLHLLK